MKIIDGDELLEELWRSDVSSREKIAEIVKKQPKIDLKNVELLYLEEEIKALWGEIDKLKDKNAKKEIDKTETYLPNTNENFGKLMLDVIKNAICDEVWKIRPEMSQKDILKGLEDGRIKITCARNSNWPFGMPFIPPKIIFE